MNVLNSQAHTVAKAVASAVHTVMGTCGAAQAVLIGCGVERVLGRAYSLSHTPQILYMTLTFHPHGAGAPEHPGGEEAGN